MTLPVWRPVIIPSFTAIAAGGVCEQTKTATNDYHILYRRSANEYYTRRSKMPQVKKLGEGGMNAFIGQEAMAHLQAR